MMTKVRQTLNQIVVNFLSWRALTDNEDFLRELGEAHFGFMDPRMSDR